MQEKVNSLKNKLSSLLWKVSVHKYCRIKVYKEQLIAKEQVKVFG